MVGAFPEAQFCDNDCANFYLKGAATGKQRFNPLPVSANARDVFLGL
jgi:hypothetical protein